MSQRQMLFLSFSFSVSLTSSLYRAIHITQISITKMYKMPDVNEWWIDVTRNAEQQEKQESTIFVVWCRMSLFSGISFDFIVGEQ